MSEKYEYSVDVSTKRTFLSLLLVTTVGCSAKKELSPEGSKKQASPGKTVEQTATPVKKTENSKNPEPLPTAPDFSAAEVDDKDAARSRSLNGEALALHREKKHAEAATLFIQALASNPGNILARYNLSCAYNLDDKKLLALEQLGQLKQDNCRGCDAQLLGAPADKDWASAQADETFVQLTTGITAESPSRTQLAKLVRTAFDKKDVTSIAYLIHPTRATQFRYVESLCNPDDGLNCESVEKSFGLTQFTRSMKELTSIEADLDGDGDSSNVSFGVSHGIGTCNSKCCEYTMESVTHGTLWLSKVCYYEKAGVLFISEIEATDES